MFLIMSTMAWALGPSDLAEGWRLDTPGETNDVAFNSTGQLVLAGREGDNAKLWLLNADSSEAANQQSAGSDTYHALVVDPGTDDVYACGQTTDSPGFLIREFDPLLSLQAWQVTYGADAPSCNGLSYTPTLGLVGAGVDAGGWVGMVLETSLGALQRAPITYSLDGNDIAMDSASSLSENFALVGSIDVGGSPQGYIQAYNPDGSLLWEYVHETTPSTVVAAIYEPVIGELIVVGNQGEAGAQDWFVTRFATTAVNQVGQIVWTNTYDGDGLDDTAAGLQIDDEGDVWIAGTTPRADGSTEWHVVEFSGYDGIPVDDRTISPVGQDPILTGLTLRDGRMAVTGSHLNPERVAHTIYFEEDSDLDGISDSLDACPTDPEKSVDAGVCGCNIDEDDYDADGTADCIDTCANDPDKVDPGICGCNVPDIDTDEDGTVDCDDRCPEDPLKIALGECGCGVPDADSDNDGVLGCNDACPNTPEGEPVDAFGCPEGQSPLIPDEPETPAPVEDEKGGCHHVSRVSFGWLWLAPGLLLATRRR